jgi:phage recombination protein Bet
MDKKKKKVPEKGKKRKAEKATLVPAVQQKAAPSAQVPIVSRETLERFLIGTGNAAKLSAEQKELFFQTAAALNLNPLKREVHLSVFKNKETNSHDMAIIVGYEVYIKRAERSGKLNGWKAHTEGEGEGKDLKAVITIWRKDWKEPFTHEVLLSECMQVKYDGSPTKFWAKQPRFMLKKIAISQGFRLCFPDELGGMPYTYEEQTMFSDGRAEVLEVPATGEDVKLLEKPAEQQVVKTADDTDAMSDAELDAAIKVETDRLTGEPHRWTLAKISAGIIAIAGSTDVKKVPREKKVELVHRLRKAGRAS